MCYSFKFVTILFFEFKNIQSYYKTIYSTYYLHSKVETNNESGIVDLLKSIYSTVTSNIQKSLG